MRFFNEHKDDGRIQIKTMTRKKYAVFRFYAELNDFLPKERRQKEIEYFFWGTPAIKDAIEALGVPHPEVDLILVDGDSVSFEFRLRGGERVSVYPVFELLDISKVTHLRPKPLRELCFVVDCNLGKLARKLRMLGFDVVFSNNANDFEIIQVAKAEHRVILTRDVELLKNKQVTHGYWVRSTKPDEQVKEVVEKFDLKRWLFPFTRCMVCNGKLQKVEKETVITFLPPKVQEHFNEFYRCSKCRKIYWPGSHYQRMLKFIASL